MMHFGSKAGVSMVELMVVLTILTVAMGMYASTVISTAKLRAIHRETAIAAEAARAAVERMHNVPLAEVFATFNDWSDDDPNGAGTAHGASFSVPGLQAIGGGNGFVGEIILPSQSVLVKEEVIVDPFTQRMIDLGRLDDDDDEKETLKELAETHLREDFQDEKLGLPRDLNGDNVIDDANHAEDYVILPVRVRLTWQGRQGERSYELSTMLTEFRRAY